MIVVCTGPESSGKTTLAKFLAAQTGAPLVAEQARSYLTNTEYVPSDLLRIARLQQSTERETATGELTCSDTDLQVIYLWWQERFGPAPRVLSSAYAAQSRRHYLLCRPDLPWEADPLRQNPHDRDRLFALYRGDLEARELAYTVVEGQGEARERAALAALAALIR